MSRATATLALGAVLKGGSKAVFKTISAGLKDISKELTKTAKDMHAMGKVEAADAVGHVATAISKVNEQYKTLSKTGKDASKAAKELVTPMKDMGKELQAVQGAWKFFSKNETVSGTALQNATKWTKQTASAINNLDQQMRQAGANTQDWSNKVKWSNIQEGLRTGALKLSGNQFQIMSAKGKQLLGLNNELGQSLDKYNRKQTVYNAELKRGSEISSKYTTAVKALGKSTLYSNEQSKIWVPTLRKVHSAMETSKAGMKGMSSEVTSWTKNSDLASVTQSVLAGNIKTTAKGFEILNEKGLKSFTGLSYQAAERLGMLSKGFAQLSVKEGATSLTEFGKALQESGTRSSKFRDELSLLSKSGLGVSKSFKTRYDDMKKTDDMFRKHTSTLQQTGVITTKTMDKMNEGFNASKVSSKDLAAALAAPEKRMQSLKGVIATVHQETGKSVESIKKLAGEYYNSSKDMGSMSERLELVKKQLQAQVPAQKALISSHKELAALEKKTSDLTGQSIEKIQAKTRAKLDEATSVKEAQLAVNESIISLKNEMTASKQVSARRKEASKAIKNLNSNYGHLLTTHPKYVQGLKDIVNGYNKSDTAGKRAVNRTTELAKSFGTAKSSASLFSRAMDDVGKHVKSFASYAAAASIIAGLVQSFRSATNAIIDYDQSLKDLQAITSATDREVALMGETIKRVASTTKFSAQEVAAGMKTLGQAGLSASEAVSTMQAVSDLATGTLTDMSTSVDLVTTAMRVFQIDASDSGHVADVFANAVNKSKLTVDKLRIAMNYVGPVAARAGISFEEVASSMMLLANSGIRASTIGTGLRQVFRKLVDPSKELYEAITAAGFSMDDFDPKAHSMREIIENLGEVVLDAEDAFTMFGMRGASAISALTAQGTKGFDKMWESVNRAGAAADMAATQMEGLGVKIKNMIDKSKNLAIALGETGLGKSLHYVVDAARLLLDGLVALTNSFGGTLLIQIGLTTAALATFYATIKTIASFASVTVFITSLKSIFTLLTAKVVLASTAVVRFTTTLASATTATGSFTAALKASSLAFFTSGIGLIIAAISALVLALGTAVLWHKKLEKAQQKALDEARNLADEYTDLSKSVVDLKVKLAKLEKGTDQYANALIEIHPKLIKVAEGNKDLANAALDAANSINPLTGELLDGGKALNAYQNEADKLKLKELAKSFKIVTDRLKSTYSPLERVYRLMKLFAKLLSFSVKDVFDAYIGFLGDLADKFSELGDKIAKTFPVFEKFGKIVKKVFDPVGTAIDVVGDKASAVGDKIQETIAKIPGLSAIGDYDSDIELLESFREGDIDFRELTDKVEEFFNKNEKGWEELRNNIIQTRIEAAKILTEMDNQGEILPSDSADTIVETAVSLGLLEDSAMEAKGALKMLAEEKREAARDFASGAAEKLAKNFEADWSKYDAYLNKSVAGLESMSEALNSLDQEVIESYRIKEEAIAKDTNAIRDKLATDKSYLAEGLEALKEQNSKAVALRKEASNDETMIRKKQLLINAELLEQELAVNEARYKKGGELTYEGLTEEIKIREKYAKEVEKIMLGTLDIDKLKKEMQAYSETRKTLLAEELKSLQLLAAEDTEGAEEGKYIKAEADAKIQALKDIEAKSMEYYQKLEQTREEDHKDLIDWNTKHEKIVQQRVDAEVDGILAGLKARKMASAEALEDVQETNTAIAQENDKAILEFEKAVALGISSVDQAAKKARESTKDEIEAEIANLETFLASGKATAEDIIKTRNLLADLNLKHTKITNDEIAANRENEQSIKDLNAERRIGILEAKAASLESGYGVTPGMDAEYKMAQQLTEVYKELNEAKVAVAENNLDLAQKTGDQKLILEAEIELYEAKEELRNDDLEAEKSAMEEKVELAEKMFEKRLISEQEYYDIVKEARDMGVLDWKEATEEMILHSNNMYEAFKLGWQRVTSEAKTNAEIIADMAEYMADAFVNDTTDAFFEFIEGTKSASEAFGDFAASFIKDLAKMMVKAMMMKTISSIFGGFSLFGDGGEVTALPASSSYDGVLAADGGLIKGYSPHDKADNIPARLTAKEFVEPVSVVEHYGADVFEAMRQKLIPKELFSLAKNGILSGASDLGMNRASFASGGYVGANTPSASSQNNSIAVSVPVSVSGLTDSQGLAGMLQQSIEDTVIAILKREIR